MARLKATIAKPLNFEMAATDQMLDIATLIAPHAACLVPEKRTERTTEGGLDVVGAQGYLAPYVDQLRRAGVRVSLFIEPSEEAIRAASAIKAPVVELHTGAWCHAVEIGDAALAEHSSRASNTPPPSPPRWGSRCTPGTGSTTTRRAASRPCQRSSN